MLPIPSPGFGKAFGDHYFVNAVAVLSVDVVESAAVTLREQSPAGERPVNYPNFAQNILFRHIPSHSRVAAPRPVISQDKILLSTHLSLRHVAGVMNSNIGF